MKRRKMTKMIVSIFLVTAMVTTGLPTVFHFFEKEAVGAIEEHSEGDCDSATLEEMVLTDSFKVINSTCWNETLNYAGNIHSYSSDSGLTARDALTILKYVVGLDDDLKGKCADADQNGVVDAEDALYVLKCAVRLEEPIILGPNAYDIYQFEMLEDGVIFYEPSDVKDYWNVIESVEELQEFVEGDLKLYFGSIKKLRAEQKEHVLRHFSSLNEEFFENNVYVVTLNGSEPYATTYTTDCLEYIEDEEGQMSGIRVKMILGSRDDDVDYPAMEINNVYGGVVIPRNDLVELEILDVVID